MGYRGNYFGCVYVYRAPPQRATIWLQRTGQPLQEIKKGAKKANLKQDTGRKYNCLSIRNGSRYGYVCCRDRLGT